MNGTNGAGDEHYADDMDDIADDNPLVLEFLHADGMRVTCKLSEMAAIRETRSGCQVVFSNLCDPMDSDEEYDLLKIRYENQLIIARET